jgi:hypothetical protein
MTAFGERQTSQGRMQASAELLGAAVRLYDLMDM